MICLYLSNREAVIASYANALIVQYVHIRFTHAPPNHPKVLEQEHSCLPSLPRQFCHAVCDVLETLSKPRSPPLRCQPLPLQSASFVELLLVEVALDLVPCHQTSQHADAPHNIPSSVDIQLYSASICGVQARELGKCLFLLYSEW